METKGIDLTKCKGWYFKAKIHRTQCEGRIQVERGVVYLCQDRMDGPECQDTWGFKYSWGILNGSKEALETNNVTDFEIIPRDPETYKDWQVGDIVASNDKTERTKEVIFRSGELVVCKNADGDIDGDYTCGQLHRLGYRLVLTDIEKQIIEEKKKAVEDIPKPYEFKKGEPVLVRSDYAGQWLLAAFVDRNAFLQSGEYGVTDGQRTFRSRYCIPFNEKTMHLLGTTEDYKEE